MNLDDVGEENDHMGFLEEPRSVAWCYSLVRETCCEYVGEDCRWMDLDTVGKESSSVRSVTIMDSSSRVRRRVDV